MVKLFNLLLVFGRKFFLKDDGSVNLWGVCASVGSFIICFIYWCIKNPAGAINTFMIKLIDLIVGYFPSTPDQYKLINLFNNMLSQLSFLGADLLQEIVNIFVGILAIFSLVLIIKLYKILPFT